jgi:hypothetical protein
VDLSVASSVGTSPVGPGRLHDRAPRGVRVFFEDVSGPLQRPQNTGPMHPRVRWCRAVVRPRQFVGGAIGLLVHQSVEQRHVDRRPPAAAFGHRVQRPRLPSALDPAHERGEADPKPCGHIDIPRGAVFVRANRSLSQRRGIRIRHARNRSQCVPQLKRVVGLEALHSRWGSELRVRLVPPWTLSDLIALAELHGVSRALSAVGIADNHDVERALEALASRADGNPLYARSLARGLVSGLGDGTITSTVEWIADAPAIAGDIAVYYAHLYKHASVQAQAIADLLAVIDFSVTENELREMLPAFVGAWVPLALAQLVPVLTAVTGQGGVRIFHESFRRFMIQELTRSGRAPDAALAPVVEWLAKRGFYEDARAYRFLLPALRRAGRGTDVISRVNTTFVSDSVSQAHPLEAIQRNLSLAADLAAQHLAWPDLVRCVELYRAAYTCFDENQNDWRDYWATYLELFGPNALAERLLFDGRPTLSRADGLYACALVDDGGGTAPWREYLSLQARGDQASSSSDTFDPQGELNSGERENLDVVHGRLRLGERTRVVKRVLKYLHECGNQFKPLLIRRLATRIARIVDVDLVERIARRGDRTRRQGARFSHRASAALRLGIADEHDRVGNRTAAREAATRALINADTAELASACFAYGPLGTPSLLTVNPAALPIAVGPGEFLHNAAGVRSWVAEIRLCAWTPASSETKLSSEAIRVDGPGWYRCWLRYVIGLARTEAARRAGLAGDIQGAFSELTGDVHPFTGKPRASDLWSIRHVIQETFAWGLTLLQSEVDWRHTVTILTSVSQETASRLDREDGGPVPIGMLLDLLLPYVSDSVGGALVRDSIEQLMTRLDADGTYYPTHAEYAMRLARKRQACGDSAGAREAWKRGAVLFAAYGWRKDITVYDVIESAPVLASLSRDVALRALADTQPLANAVVAHTDGRSTKHAPNTWLKCLLQVQPAVATAVLAQTLNDAGVGGGGWPIRRAVQRTAECLNAVADPRLVDALFSTLRFEVEHETEAVELANARLAPVLRLLTTDRVRAATTMRRVVAEITGDGRRNTDLAGERATAVAEEHGLAIPRFERVNQVRGGSGPDGVARQPSGAAELPNLRVPPFPVRATLVDLFTGLRRAGLTRRWDDDHAWDDLALAFGYHVCVLIDSGQEDDARRLLRFFARDTNIISSGAPHPLQKVATLLADGYPRAAAMAYALAYTATRGGGGWRHMGDHAHGCLLQRAIELDSETARQAVADEVAYAIRRGGYGGGTSLHLIEQLAAWGEPEASHAAWLQLFSVVRHRLPLASAYGRFAPLHNDGAPGWPGENWSVNEALVALLLARLGNPRLASKVKALAGVLCAIEDCSDAVAAPMRWWMTRNAHFTSIMLVLETLGNGERPPFLITKGLEDVMRGYAECDIWGLRRLAVTLLERAGCSVTDIRHNVSLDDNGAEADPLDPTEQATLLSTDIGSVLDSLAPLWPELPGRIARRLRKLVNIEGHRKRIKARYRVSHGRDADAYPPTPTLHWEVELFEMALHEALCGLPQRLWITGQWEPEIEETILRRVLPHVRLHLALAASRTPRPAWPSTEQAIEGLGVLPELGADDPAYEGWVRLAFVERFYRRDSTQHYARPVEAIDLFAGTIAVPLGTSIPVDAFPFAQGDVDEWWWPSPQRATSRDRLPMGQIVKLERSSDWLGDPLLLIPPTAIHSCLRLTPPAFGEPLTWRDARGDAAVVLRTWWLRNPDASFTESAACEGSDLLVRPDLSDRLLELYGVTLQELRTVRRRTIPAV